MKGNIYKLLVTCTITWALYNVDKYGVIRMCQMLTLSRCMAIPARRWLRWQCCWQLRVEKWILSVQYVSSEHVMQSEVLVYPMPHDKLLKLMTLSTVLFMHLSISESMKLLHDIWVFHSSFVEDPRLLGCDTALPGKWLLKFWRNAVPSTSSIEGIPEDDSNILFFKYKQQDATLYNILCYCQCSTCFRWFLRPSSGAQKLYVQHQIYVKLACNYR